MELRMEVTRIHKLEGTGPTKAFVDLAIEDAFIIKGIRIVEGKDGMFVSMPREEGKDGKWYHVVVPLKREIKDQIEKIVLEAYGVSMQPFCFGKEYSARKQKCKSCEHKIACRDEFLKQKVT
jgi:stage V sporulation protein G